MLPEYTSSFWGSLGTHAGKPRAVRPLLPESISHDHCPHPETKEQEEKMNTLELWDLVKYNTEQQVPGGTPSLPRLILTRCLEPAVQVWIRNPAGGLSHCILLSPRGTLLSSRKIPPGKTSHPYSIRRYDPSDPMVALYLTLLCKSLLQPTEKQLHSLEILWYSLATCDLRKLWEDGEIDA